MENFLEPEYELPIARYIKDCINKEKYELGCDIARRFLINTDRHWKDAGNEFLENYSDCSYHANDLQLSLEIVTYLLKHRQLSESERRMLEFNQRHYLDDSASGLGITDLRLNLRKALESGNTISIKPMAWWTDSQTLSHILNAQSKGSFRWNNLELTWNDDADYFVIFQRPRKGDYYDPKRSIVFQTEALSEEYPEIWSPEWADPDPLKYFHVRKHKDFPNCPDWHIGVSYQELIKGSHPEKSALFSAIVSGNYVLPGHKKRVDFLRFYERQSDVITIDIFGRDNTQGFINYLGTLPEREKVDGLFPYQYTFNAENSFVPNYYTEKIIDAILAETLCFYWGCPNLEEIIDPQCFIRLDLDDMQGSLEIIQAAIANDEWSRRLPAIREQKRKILEENHFFPIIENILHEASTPVYVINLDRRPDRWKDARRNLLPYWKNFIRYPAIDGQALKHEDAQLRIFDGNKFADRRAVSACALSHINLWRQLSEDLCHDHYLILEDDIEFCHDFDLRLQEVLQVINRNPWDIIYLGSHVRREFRNSRHYERKAGMIHLSTQQPTYMIGGTFAYLVSHQGAKKLLNLVETECVRYPIDTWMMLQFNRLRVFFTEPHLVFSEYLSAEAAGAKVDTDIQKDFLPPK